LKEYTPYDFALEIFDTMPGFIAVDPDGKIVFIRERYANRLGTTKKACIGRPIEEIIPNSELPSTLQQNKSAWGQHQRHQSGITGDYMGDVICNRLVIRDPEDQHIKGAVEFVAVHEYQDKDALTSEMTFLRQQNEMYRKHIAALYQAEDKMKDIIGTSAKVTEMKKLIRRVADTSATICISGETGTGKELVANAIHKLSSRSEGPFVKINCAAIPKNLMESELFGYDPGAFTGAARQGKLGIFELANGGSLLLDEIGEMPLELQAKLLRVLQEREVKRIGGTRTIPVDVRIICSTNQNLQEMVAAGSFRADLYYRINTMEVIVPPLRDRADDIPALANFFIKNTNRRNGLAVSELTPQVSDLLKGYRWPGNIRELEHSIERACILCGAGSLTEEHFSFMARHTPEPIKESAAPPPDTSFRAAREKAEAERILQALKACYGNRIEAAALLNISRTTLFRKMKKYGFLDLE